MEIPRLGWPCLDTLGWADHGDTLAGLAMEIPRLGWPWRYHPVLAMEIPRLDWPWRYLGWADHEDM